VSVKIAMNPFGPMDVFDITIFPPAPEAFTSPHLRLNKLTCPLRLVCFHSRRSHTLLCHCLGLFYIITFVIEQLSKIMRTIRRNTGRFFCNLGTRLFGSLGFVALALVFSQIITAIGYGYYFPWSVPALFSGAGGAYKG
jgi:hypothetical protein